MFIKPEPGVNTPVPKIKKTGANQTKRFIKIEPEPGGLVRPSKGTKGLNYDNT